MTQEEFERRIQGFIQEAKAAGVSDEEIQRRVMVRRVEFQSSQVPEAVAKPEAVARPKESWVSRALPVAGAVVGGTAGSFVGPLGAVVGAGGGAMAGESLREFLRGETIPEEVIKQSLYGAGAELAGLGVARAVGAVARPALRIAGRVLGITPRELIQTAIPIRPSVVNQASKRGMDIYGELLDEGVTGSRQVIADTLETKAGTYATQLRTVLEEATNKGIKVPTKKIVDLLKPIASKLREVAVVGKEAVIDRIEGQISAIKALGKTITPLEAQAQKIAISDFIKFNVRDPTLSQEMLQTVRWGWKKEIEDAVGGDVVRTLNTKIGAFEIAAEALGELGERELNLGIREIFGLPSLMAAFGAPGFLLAGPTGAAVGGAMAVPVWMTNVLAKASPEFATSFAQALTRLAKTSPTIANLLAPIGRVVTQVGIRAIPLPGRPGEVRFEERAPEVPGVPTTPTLPARPTAAPGVPTEDQFKQAYWSAFSAGDKKAADMIQDAQKFFYGTKAKTEAQVAREDTVAIAQAALTDLMANPRIKTGPVVSRLEEWKGKYTEADEDTLVFNRKIYNLFASIAKARAGVALTPNEEKRLRGYVPEIGDTKQMLKIKLEGLIDFFTVLRPGVEIGPSYGVPATPSEVALPGD